MDARALYNSIGSERGFWKGVDEAGMAKAGHAPAQLALRKIAKLLEEEGIAYAVAGALALGQHGYVRATTDVDLLLTREGLAALKRAALGKGWLEKFPGSKRLRDTELNVAIDVLVAGDYPGDGKPKPVVFPDPAEVGVRAGDARFLRLGTLIELKLASGLSAAHRVKDLADVQELIKAAKLPRELGAELDASVRSKYEELWTAVEAAPADEE